MNTIVENFDGIDLIRPVGSFKWKHTTFKGFPTCCGAGKFGDLIVPDTMWGVNVSPACQVHDDMYEMAEPSWAEFHYSNAILFLNCASIITANSTNFITRNARIARAAFYLLMVSTAGAPIFWGIKQEQALCPK